MESVKNINWDALVFHPKLSPNDLRGTVFFHSEVQALLRDEKLTGFYNWKSTLDTWQTTLGLERWVIHQVVVVAYCHNNGEIPFQLPFLLERIEM